MRWHERGELAWNGQRLTVFRTLHVVPVDDGWTVRFDDGREFHPWLPGARSCTPAAPTRYRGLVAVDRPATCSASCGTSRVPPRTGGCSHAAREHGPDRPSGARGWARKEVDMAARIAVVAYQGVLADES